MMKEENQTLISHGFQINSLPLFERWITEKFARNDYHDFFMIEDSLGNTIGFTYSHDYYIYDAHCKYTLCLYEEYQNRGDGAIAGIKMLDYLFSKYPLKQVFISVFDYNSNSLNINRRGGFEEVGVLPEYRYKGGGYYSLHVMRITREHFYEVHRKHLSKIE